MLNKIREDSAKFVGEITNPIQFPVHYALTLNSDKELLILCYLSNRNNSFAMWTRKCGLSAISFEPLHSLSINDCLPSILEFCEQLYEAWNTGNQTGPSDCNDRDRRSSPADGEADEASS